MKIWLKITVAALLLGLFTTGCGGDKGPESEPNYDGWVLRTLDNSGALAGKVYLQLMPSGTFTLYQNINTPGFRIYKGSYLITTDTSGGDVLSGTYNDGTQLKEQYMVSGIDGKVLTTTGMISGEIALYDAVEVPAYVKDGVTDDSRATDRTERFL